MNDTLESEIKWLLTRCQSGDKQARDELFNRLYPELKRVAFRRLHQSNKKITIQATEVINELYIRFSKAKSFPSKNRLYFFAAAATAIEQIIVDYYRSKTREKRGGHATPVELDAEYPDNSSQINEDMVLLGQLLHQLKNIDPDCSAITQLKLLAGMKNVEVAEILSIPLRTVGRKWAFAKNYLNYHL